MFTNNKINIPHIIIKPAKGLVPFNFKELWAYRSLLFILTWREIKVRYKQTIFGVAWAIVQPLMIMIVFTIFFGILGSVATNGIPYPLFSYTALLPWTLFSNSITKASNSLVQDANLIQKVYFPKILIPTASVIAPIVDFAFSLIVLIGLMLYYQILPTMAIFYLPLFLIMEMILALGVGYWLSAINVEYRDVNFATPFLMQLWMFASPIIYSVDFVPERFQMAYSVLNPMVGVIDGFRWTLLGTSHPSNMLFASIGVILFIFITGALYFRYREKTFADVV